MIYNYRFFTESRFGICGDVLLTPTGVIQSPGFGQYPYPPNQRCVWKIITDPERRIALSVKNDAFNIPQIPQNGHSCTKDKLTIFDGESQESIRIGSFCGRAMRKLETVYSTGNSLYLEFVSGLDLTQAIRNFELHYTTFIQGMFGIIILCIIIQYYIAVIHNNIAITVILAKGIILECSSIIYNYK